MTFQRVFKNVVTVATKVTARVVSEEVEEEEYQEPRIRLDGAPENHLFSGPFVARGVVVGHLFGQTAPQNPLVSLNALVLEDSACTDYDEDLAEGLDKFFGFMIWNDLSGEEGKEDSSFIEDEEREGSVSATEVFAEINDFEDIIIDDSDDGYLPQVSDNRVMFPRFAQEARYGFSLQARPKRFRRRL